MNRLIAALGFVLVFLGADARAQVPRPMPPVVPPSPSGEPTPPVDETGPSEPRAGAKPSPATPAATDAKAEIRKTIEARKARRVRSAAKSQALKQQQAALAKAQVEYRAKMAPLLAAAESPSIRRQLEAQTAQVLQQMARGALDEAENLGRAVVEDLQRNGIPPGVIPNGLEAIPNRIGLPR